MKTEITDDLINDIFNIPRDGSNISDDDDGPDISDEGSRLPFADKVKEVVKDLSSLPPSPKLEVEKPVAENKPEPKPDVESAIKAVQKSRFGADLFGEEPKVEPKAEVKVEASVPVAPVVEVVQVPDAPEILDDDATPPWEDKKVVEVEAKSAPKVDTLAEVKVQKPQPTPSLITKVSTRWKLISPELKFNKFYEEKASVLSNYLLKGDEIPFDKYFEELGEASVDIDVPIWDSEEVGRRITLVQKWRDRIKAIQLHVNKQYFVWSRFIDLLSGVLARVDYEKPAERQKGVTYEHLSDFEGYFGALEGLHNSCQAVNKHLDAAYNSLSRQAAIVQPLNESERWTPTAPRPMSAKQTKYDAVQTNANSRSDVAAQPKEAGKKPAEPSSGWDIM